MKLILWILIPFWKILDSLGTGKRLTRRQRQVLAFMHTRGEQRVDFRNEIVPLFRGPNAWERAKLVCLVLIRRNLVTERFIPGWLPGCDIVLTESGKRTL